MEKILSSAIEKNILKKVVLSKPKSDEIKKAVGMPIELKGECFLCLETFYSDNKARHTNIKKSDAAGYIADKIGTEYNQLNIITTSGDCEVKISKKGKRSIINKIKSDAPSVDLKSHNKQKNHILSDSEPIEFLRLLGVKDEKGRVYDKKRSKFNQINRFLELVRDIDGMYDDQEEMYILDLCCGKSYLSFAVYYYFAELKGKKVEMYGVDLKSDVIENCNEAAKKSGFAGLHFICGDINDFKVEKTPDLTVSLHACDIATDIVLAKAIKSGSRAILSTPCCHHEMMHTLKPCGSDFDFMMKHSILKQKLCDAATDSLRATMLEAFGYDTKALELIDPNETPKNVLIRAIKKGKINPEKKKEYNEICEKLQITPYLKKLLNE